MRYLSKGSEHWYHVAMQLEMQLHRIHPVAKPLVEWKIRTFRDVASRIEAAVAGGAIKAIAGGKR